MVTNWRNCCTKQTRALTAHFNTRSQCRREHNVQSTRDITWCKSITWLEKKRGPWIYCRRPKAGWKFTMRDKKLLLYKLWNFSWGAYDLQLLFFTPTFQKEVLTWYSSSFPNVQRFIMNVFCSFSVVRHWSSLPSRYWQRNSDFTTCRIPR